MPGPDWCKPAWPCRTQKATRGFTSENWQSCRLDVCACLCFIWLKLYWCKKILYIYIYINLTCYCQDSSLELLRSMLLPRKDPLLRSLHLKLTSNPCWPILHAKLLDVQGSRCWKHSSSTRTWLICLSRHTMLKWQRRRQRWTGKNSHLMSWKRFIQQKNNVSGWKKKSSTVRHSNLS